MNQKYLEEIKRREKNQKTLFCSLTTLTVLCIIVFTVIYIKSYTYAEEFQIARKELTEDKKRNVIEAAKQLLRDSDKLLVELENENLKSITDSDVDYLRCAWDFVLDIESRTEMPPFFLNNVDILITHVANAVGNDDYSFNLNDLTALKQLSEFMTKNEVLIQMGDELVPLHVLEYKIASRIK